MRTVLEERFKGISLDERLAWLSVPPRWTMEPDPGLLVVRPAGHTDFWQRTHYGFRADNGHFLFMPLAGDFVVTTRVWFQPVHQYDQAGLMVRLSPNCWLKTAVEYEPDRAGRLGAVVTNDGYSDWSTQDFPADRHDLWLRVRRQESDYLVDFSFDGQDWNQLRVAHLAEDRSGPVDVGLYACSPQGEGFVARFGFLRIVSGRVEAENE